MLEQDIKKLIEKGWWISVIPVNNGKWQFSCEIYKRLPSGNWITATRKTFKTPQLCYDWALDFFENQEPSKKRR